jgi:integration host factor subunit beta
MPTFSSDGDTFMNRSDLISKLAELTPNLQAKDVELGVKIILEKLASTIANGSRVEIRGFGSFGLNYRKPRNGRNPRTGATIKVTAKYHPRFKPGKALKELPIQGEI